ncbi:hypothetical protein D3C86_1379460 [compost metagenome]
MRCTLSRLVLAMLVISVRLREMSSATEVCSSAAVAIWRFMSRMASTARVMRSSMAPASVTCCTLCSLRD